MEQQNLRDAARLSLGKSRQLRKAILEKADELKNSLGDSQRSKNVNLTVRLEEIDSLLKQLRLACMEVIFYDFEYAHEKETEASLWQTHVVLNTEYRRVVAHVNTQNLVVLKRKVDKLYRDFLKTSQFFYRGYIQRLSGQFYIPELRQIAQGLQVDPFTAAQQDPAPSAALRTKLVNSCYLTLVRMGDLARYRCQNADKASKASFDIALTYYGLAQMLDPDDGASYHQTAVLYQPSAKQLEIIYYFLRSVCVAKPHKLGAANLERAFKGLLGNQPVSKSNSKNAGGKNPTEALIAWFLKLHAYYFQGVNFSAQSELEKEVLHRLEVCLKADGNEALALKMVLLNIAACDFAFDNIKETKDWTLERSQSCQFSLFFQVRVAVIILRVFKTIVRDDLVSDLYTDQQTNETGKSTIEISAPCNRLLPLIRILLAWIYVSREKLTQYQDWLEPSIRDLHSLAADVLTSLLPLATSNVDVADSQYLLPEDIEALGLQPFSDRKLPLFLLVQILPEYNPPKCRKTTKSRKDFIDTHYNPQIENVWRIRDIICCGIYLAGSANSPLTIVTSAEDIDTWVYLKDGPLKPIDQASMTRMLGQVKMGAYKVLVTPNGQAARDDGASKSPLSPSAADQMSPLSVLEGPGGPTKAHERQSSKFLGYPVELSTKLSFDDEMSADPNMAGMVNKLLDEDEDDAIPQRGETHNNTSYGMESSVANDVFGNLVPSPVSKAPTTVASNGKIIPNLPWNYFYNPSPTKEAAGYSPTDGLDVPRSALGQADCLSTGLGEQNPIFTKSNQASNANRGALSMYGHQEAPRPAQAPPGFDYRTPSNLNSPSYSADQRAAALDNLKSALFAQYGTSAGSSPSPSYAYGQPISPKQNGEPRLSRQGHRARTSISSPLANMQSSPDSFAQNRDPISQGFQDLQLGRYRQGSTVRPPIGRSVDLKNGVPIQPTSPSSREHDFAGRVDQGTAYSGAIGSPDIGHMTFAQQVPALSGNTSSLAFSNPSSLWAGTPAAPQAPRGTVACNGNFFNATTPFGRAGDINNRDDPTHFRNRLQDLGVGVGESVAAYDRAILDSAMTDITNDRPHQQ